MYIFLIFLFQSVVMYANGEDVLKCRHISKVSCLDLVTYEQEFPEKWLRGDDMPDNLSGVIGSCDNEIKEQLAHAIYCLVRKAAIVWGEEPDELWQKERSKILSSRVQYKECMEYGNCEQNFKSPEEESIWRSRVIETTKVYPIDLDAWKILFKERIKKG